MNNGEDSKAGPPQESPDEAEVLQHFAQDIAAQVQGLLGLFAPTFNPENLPRLIGLMVNEQLVIAQEILPSFSDAEAVKKLPRVGARIYPKTAPGQEPDASRAKLFIVNKHFGAAEDCANALETAFVVALLLQPGVRAMLRVHGYHYDFVQIKEKSSLILPGG